jgi:AcrR family transcriptional regulator
MGDGRQRILHTAEELFTERGYQAVSIREIARACDMTNAALYYHFPSKAALFHEVMEQHVANLKSRMQQAGSISPGHKEKVRNILAEYARAAGHHAPFFLLRRELGHGSFQNQYESFLRSMLEPLEKELQLAIEAKELRSLPEESSPAALLVGMLQGLVQYRKAGDGRRIYLEDVSLVVDIFWEGMKA